MSLPHVVVLCFNGLLIIFALAWFFVYHSCGGVGVDRQANNNVAITCHSEVEVIRQERLRCQVIVQSLRDLYICDCSEELQQMEDDYRQIIWHYEQNYDYALKYLYFNDY